jgi:hypothetical protein
VALHVAIDSLLARVEAQAATLGFYSGPSIGESGAHSRTVRANFWQAFANSRVSQSPHLPQMYPRIKDSFFFI